MLATHNQGWFEPAFGPLIELPSNYNSMGPFSSLCQYLCELLARNPTDKYLPLCITFFSAYLYI